MRPYSTDLRERVVAAMECGGSCRDVGAQFGVAPSTAGNWHRRYRRTKRYAPMAVGGDRRWKLAGEVQWIAQRLAAVPDLTLAEVRGDLAARGIEVSAVYPGRLQGSRRAGVQRTVKRLGLRFKKAIYATEQGDERFHAGGMTRRIAQIIANAEL